MGSVRSKGGSVQLQGATELTFWNNHVVAKSVLPNQRSWAQAITAHARHRHMTMDQCEWRNSCNRQSYGGGPWCRSHSGGGSSCCVVFVPQCGHWWRCGRRRWPSPAGPAVSRSRQLALLRAVLLAQEEQQSAQSVSYRRDACRHVFAGSVAGHLPYQRRPCTWRRSNTGVCSPGGRIWLLTISSTIFPCVAFLIIWWWWWYDIMIYLLTAIALKPGGSNAVHIYTKTVHRTTQWQQNIQKRKYITTRRIEIYKIKQKHTKHTTIYKMIQHRTKRMWHWQTKQSYKQQASFDLTNFE